MPKHILIVDDNPEEVELLKLFLSRKGICNPVHVVPDGLLAIDYLYGLEPYFNRRLHPFPGLVFLDINMPRRSGYEVLEWFESHPEIPKPKIVICTNALSPAECQKCHGLGADFILLRSTLQQQLAELLSRYPDIWELADSSGPVPGA